MIRIAVPEDIHALISINQELDAYGWPDNYFYELERSNTIIWVAEDSAQQICGYIICSTNMGEAKIINLTISTKFRGQGIGKLLLEHALTLLKSAGFLFVMLNVRVDNSIAIQLYTLTGFKTLCVWDNYYSDLLTDAYYMQLDLRKFQDLAESSLETNQPQLTTEEYSLDLLAS